MLYQLNPQFLLLRVGFILIQLASVPIENIYIIIIHNIIDIAVSILSFGLIGYMFAYGASTAKSIGLGVWIGSNTANFDQAIMGFCSVIIATGIITTILSGRLHAATYIIGSILYSALIQPMIIHWIWHGSGWMHHSHFMDKLVSVKDYGGGLVIHVCAGIFGFVGAIALGRRLLLLNTIAETSIGVDGPANILIGYIFIALGLIAFSLSPPFYNLTHIPRNYIGHILVNYLLAMAAGMIIVVILQFLCYNETFNNYWIVIRCIQGGIVGIVALAPGVDVYNPLFALLTSVLAASLFYLVAMCIRESAFEDYCNIIPIHLVGGILGTILPPIFGTHENLGFGVSIATGVVHMLWQLVCLFIIVIVMLIVSAIFFGIMSCLKFLRNEYENVNHNRGKIVARMAQNPGIWERLFHLNPGTPLVEPGSLAKSATKNSQEYIKRSSDATNAQSRQNSLFDSQRQRSIYTVPNITHNPVHDLCLYSMGDAAQKSCLIVQPHKSPNNITTETVSCYNLHRTKKCTNIISESRTLSMLQLEKIHPENDYSRRSLDCILYDTKFADDFITLKIPPKCCKEDLSESD